MPIETDINIIKEKEKADQDEHIKQMEIAKREIEKMLSKLHLTTDGSISQ